MARHPTDVVALKSDTHDEWRQGSLLPLAATPPALYWAHPVQQSSRPARSAVRASRRERAPSPEACAHAVRAVREGERAVVIGHTCDLVKSAETMPQVELARAFTTDNATVIAEATNLGSSRYFRLDDGAGTSALVLDYSWRTFVDKAYLAVYAPENDCVRAPERRKALARWLGRRYMRPVLSDEDVESIADPIRRRWQRLAAEEPETAGRYGAEFSEFRFRRDANGVTLYTLSPRPDPDVVVSLEVASVLVEALEPHHGVVHVADVRSYYTFTKADELRTEQIDLDWASHEEGVAVGELPAD